VSISQERGWAANIERHESDKAKEQAKDKRGGGGGMVACREAGGQTFGSTVHECTSRGSAVHTQTDTRSVKAKSRLGVSTVPYTVYGRIPQAVIRVRVYPYLYLYTAPKKS